jgi:Cys-tRNA(Pro)/Cys-tRNA(Cys) deacylase
MTPATRQLDQAKVSYRLHRYEHDPKAESYGGEAADKLQVSASRVFKTLLACGESGELLVAIVPVDGKLNLKALAQAAGFKRCAMADPVAAQRSTGYLVGGISPLGQKKRLPTFIDRGALEWESIYVSAGRRGLEIELAPQDLAQQTGAAFADIGRD